MRGCFYTPREAIIPKGAVRVADRHSDAVAYIFERSGQPCAMIFYGKQAKPVAHFRYGTAERRTAFVGSYFESRRKSLAFKAERTAKRRAWTPTYKVGDIFRTCWGYEQTNVEYFEIIEIRGKHAILREIAQETVETGWAQGKCAPLPGHYLKPRYDGDDRGKPIRRLMQEHGIKIDDVRTARLVPPTIIAGVPIYGSASWTAYH